jgi:hypothetical protein
MDYLHILYMTLMVWIYVLCLIVFMYVYYRLFICINLVNVMSLFFTIFFFSMTDFLKKSANFLHYLPGNRQAGFRQKSVNFW